MQTILKEFVVKNAIILSLLYFLYKPILFLLADARLDADLTLAGNILTTVSIFSVLAAFGCFAFTYEKINLKSRIQRYVAHITTGLFMLAIGVSLSFTHILLLFILGNSIIITGTLTAIYLAIIGYDYWDLMRLFNK